MPREDGDVCIASYMNFLIVNGGVIVPQYGDENDGAALAQIREMSRTGKWWASGQRKSYSAAETSTASHSSSQSRKIETIINQKQEESS